MSSLKRIAPLGLRWMPRGVAPRRVLSLWLALGVLGCAFVPGIAHAAEVPNPAPPLQAMVSHVGMSRLAFSRLNENDAKAAYKVLINELGRKLGYDLTTELRMFDSSPEFAGAIRAGKVTFLILSTWELMEMDAVDAVDIAFSALNGKSITHRWQLLVRRESGLKTITDLRGKKIIVLHNNMAALGRPWIESCLLEQGLGTPEQFFGAMESVSKTSAAILPVFFGKVDACIVDQPALDIMTDLNPQVGLTLAPIAQSEALLNGIVCLNKTGWPSAKSRDDMLRAVTQLDSEPAGRQLLTIFRCDRLVPFEPAHFEAVKRLHARLGELQKKNQP
jgi:ABC-type phosphate/phosphonate transport system substrate-binding protein